MNLQESIKRILMEDNYSPAGKEVIPNKIIVHKSNPMFRDDILKNGFKVRVGECYQIYVNREQRDPNKIKCKPVIFATNSTKKMDLFDSTYDDDIWEVNTEMIPDVKWYTDRHYEKRSKHIVTFQDIPREAITLIYEGTGDSEDLLQENIRRILREENSLLPMIRRRIPHDDLEKEFIESLDRASGMLVRISQYGRVIRTKKSFEDITISLMMDGIHYKLHSTLPENSNWYDDVSNNLKDYYRHRINVRYNKIILDYR